MANYDPQVESKAVAELARLGEELKRVTEAFEANTLGAKQYEQALERLQPQIAAQRELIAQQAQASQVYDVQAKAATRAQETQAQAAQRAAEIQKKAAQQAADVQAKAAEYAAESQARMAERGAEIQARAAVRAQEMQEKAARQAAEIQARAAEQAAEVQKKAADEAAAVQGTDAEKAADIQAKAAQQAEAIQKLAAERAAALQKAGADQASAHQARAAEQAATLQAQAANRAANAQSKAAEQAATIQQAAAEQAANAQSQAALRAEAVQEQAAARAAGVQARQAKKAAEAQAVEAERAAQKILDAEKKKDDAVAKGAGKNAQVLFQMGQIIEDVQYGFHSIINNIAFIALQKGWSGGIIFGITAIGVALNQLIKNWDYVAGLFQKGLPIESIRTASDELKKVLESNEAVLSEINKRTKVSADHIREYLNAQKNIVLHTQQEREEQEKINRLINLRTARTQEEQERELAFKKAVGEKGGDRFQELEQEIARKLREEDSAFYKKNTEDAAILQKRLDTGSFRNGLDAVNQMEEEKKIRNNIDKLAQARLLRDDENAKKADDFAGKAAGGSERHIKQLERWFPEERNPDNTGQFLEDTPARRAGAMIADVRNVEKTGMTQAEMEAKGEANSAAFRREQREKAVQHRKEVEQAREADALDQQKFAQEQAKERAQRALDMGGQVSGEDEALVRQPGTEFGQHRRDAEWEEMKARGLENNRRRQEEQRAKQKPPQAPPPIDQQIANQAPWMQVPFAMSISPADHMRDQIAAQQRAMAGEYNAALGQISQALMQAQMSGNQMLVQQLHVQAAIVNKQMATFNSQLQNLMNEFNRMQMRNRPGRGW